MPILTLAITEDGLARLKRRADLQHVPSVRQYCIWLLANDAAKADVEVAAAPEAEAQTVAA